MQLLLLLAFALLDGVQFRRRRTDRLHQDALVLYEGEAIRKIIGIFLPTGRAFDLVRQDSCDVEFFAHFTERTFEKCLFCPEKMSLLVQVRNCRAV